MEENIAEEYEKVEDDVQWNEEKARDQVMWCGIVCVPRGIIRQRRRKEKMHIQ